MSEIIRSKRKLGLILGTIFLALTMVAGSIAWVLLGDFSALASAEEKDGKTLESDEHGDQDNEDPGESDGFIPEEVKPEPVYNVPDEMRGVYLVPGYDFLKDIEASEDTIKAEVDKSLTDAVNFTMNTVIIDTVYLDKVIFETSGAPVLPVDFDVMEYIVGQAKDKGLYVYAIFDATLFEQGNAVSSALAMNYGGVNILAANVREFADKYTPDAVLIDGYTTPVGEGQGRVPYYTYLVSGGAMGYDNYLRQSPATVVSIISKTLRAHNPNIQVGLLADAVWANDTEEEEGSPTKASFTALVSGNADTKGFVEEGAVDFVAVKAFASITDTAEPFETVVTWWADVARKNHVPLYVVHASSKACTQNAGWAAHDQLTRQVIRASSINGYAGSIFDSLSRLVANPQDTTMTLVKYYNNEVKSEQILTELQITKPEMTTFTTQEPSVTFTGASDPNSNVTINGSEVLSDSSGYFTATYDLKGGQNVFTITHKTKTLTYTITRNIEILKEAAPTGAVTTDGNMSIAITALAYEDAEVSAVINGTTIRMEKDDSAEDEASRDSNYARFAGYYTTPAGIEKEQNLGAITINASWQGLSKSLTGATVKVNKKARMEDGVPVVVIADQAMTYPAKTLNNIPNAEYYPLPKGAMDYAVGDEITYVSAKNETYKYQVLASGLRVESKDIQAISNDYPSGNAISGINVTTEGRYTYVTIKTAQKVSYKIKYTGSEFIITFSNTTSNPGDSTTLNKNPIFSHAEWDDDSLALSLVKNGGFMGYKGYYDNAGNLVFRFNSPPASISGARIAIDSGHGGSDFGALGFLAAYPEKVVNLAIAKMLADELESRGATVMLINNAKNPSLENRVRQAEDFNADLFVSVHNNTAPRASAIGTETYYFYPYSKSAAAAISAQVSGQLQTDNRGARQSYYNVTLSAQVPSVLVECGFLTNKSEYEKIITEDYQQAIAVGIADGLSAGIKSAATGVAVTGSQNVGDGAGHTTDTGNSKTDYDENDDSGNSKTGTEPLEDIYFDEYEETEINVGASYNLTVRADPDDANTAGITFKSSNTSVATVSPAGKVTGVKEGSAEITVTSADRKFSDVCTIIVVKSGSLDNDATSGSTDNSGIPLSKVKEYVEFEYDYTDIYLGSTVKLNIDSELGFVRNTDFVWKSDDKNVATVDSSGRVTGKKEGYAEITAYTKDGKYEIYCEIEVTKTKTEVKEISLSEDSIRLVSGETKKLTATISPSNATNQGITWSSDKTTVARVDENGTVTARGNAGTATITATSKDGKYKATCKVEVVKNAIKVEEIYFEDESIECYVDDEFYISYEIYPGNATSSAITWKSSNSNIVQVDEEGYIICLRKGKATITATSSDNTRISANCVIIVSD